MMLTLAFLAALAGKPAAGDTVPTGPRAAAARAEAEAFAALEENRDCDAAGLFEKANALAADDRLIFNEALALAHAGDTAAATAAFARVSSGKLAAAAAKESNKLAAAKKHSKVCVGESSVDDVPLEPLTTAPAPARAALVDDEAPVPPASPRTSPRANTDGHDDKAPEAKPRTPLLPWSVGALAGGVVVAGSAAGAWLYFYSVLTSADSSGDAKAQAQGSQPALLLAGSVGGLLLVTGAALVPFAIAPGDS
jgi:hypothetical protein